jgi:Pectate lyase superfamily protein
MSTKVQLTGGPFEDAMGNVLANGYLTMTLSQDGTVPSVALVGAGVGITIQLDSNGNIVSSPAQSVWGNDVIRPDNTYYRVTGYTQQGQPAWGSNNQQVVGGPTFDVGQWTPNALISILTSGSGPALQTNEVPNGSQVLLDLHQQGSVTLTDNRLGRVTVGSASTVTPQDFSPTAGSGSQNYAGGMTSSSNILTLRLGTQSNPTAPISGGQLFAATDIGKSILVSGPNGGAGASQIVNLYTTIASYQSPTQVTLAAAAPSGGIATNFSGEVYWWNSSQDDTAAIQSAINACDFNNQYSDVYLPAGVYIRTGTLTNSLNMKTMRGDGIKRTVILTPSTAVQNDALYFTDQVYFTMKGMTWRGPGQDAVFGGRLRFDLYVESVLFGLAFEDVEVKHVAYDGIYFNTLILGTFRNCLFNYTAGHAVNMNTAVSCTFDSCYFITNYLSGINMTNCAAMKFNACANESNGIGYYMNGGTWGVSFSGCDAEFQTKRAPSAPVSFPTVTVSSGGSVTTGTYRFKYTWQRQVTNNSTPAESLPSPESSPVVVTSGNQTISFTIPAAPTDVLYVNYANVYVTNGATGTETFLGKVTLNAGPTTVTYSTPITGDGSTFPPLTSMLGHHYAIENANNISILGSTCNTVPVISTDPRFIIITGHSWQVSCRQTRFIQQLSPPPAFYVEIDAPPVGTSPSDQIFIESGDLTGFSMISIDASVNNFFLNNYVTGQTVGGQGLTITGNTPSVGSGIGLGRTTAATATAGAATLPANPVGFLEINLAGTMYKLPYYAA